MNIQAMPTPVMWVGSNPVISWPIRDEDLNKILDEDGNPISSEQYPLSNE